MLLNCGAGEDSWVPWTARRSKQSILKEINSEYPLEELMLKLNISIWPPDAKSQLVGKYPDARKDWGKEEKHAAEDEMAGWHHWLNGHEFKQTPGNSEGQDNLVCYISWGHRLGHDWTTVLIITQLFFVFLKEALMSKTSWLISFCYFFSPYETLSYQEMPL